MASITLSVEISELTNDELDSIERKLLKLFGDNKNKFPGSITDVSELTREEDEDEDEEND